jgi:outer membrane protein OmpA-like peptidoglycan-associated protein
MIVRRRWVPVWLAVVAGCTAVASEARAEYPDPGVYIGAFGGGTLKLNDWDLGVAPRDRDVQPKSAPIFGLRLGYHVLPQLVGEIGGGWLPLKSTDGGSNTGFKYDFDGYYHLLPGDISPIVGAGTGAYLTTDSGDLGGDNDIQVHATVGLRALVTDHIALRADLRDYFVDAYSTFGGNNLELTAGIDIYPIMSGDEPPPPPSDRDHDGVFDGVDECPDERGPETLKGCPDRDGDGVADAQDQCPDQPGDPKLAGCPPKDQDGDGVLDDEDKCPTRPGLAALQGCMDTDGDGLSDEDDRCPKQAGPKETKGCPDRDGDTVVDIDDKCPDEAGLPEHEGCVPDAVAAFTGKVKGINFQTGSARILTDSYPTLDEALKVLTDYPSLRLRIDGHTDNRGESDMNMQLSRDRATSVKNYLVAKGIDSGRLETAGYGDTKPVAGNQTAKGRSANRRIEFSVLRKERANQ